MQRKVKDRVKNKNKENKVKGISIEFKKEKNGLYRYSIYKMIGSAL